MSRISDGLSPAKHLIEQQQFRLGRKRARKLEPLAPGDGQRIGRPVEHVAQADVAADLLGDASARRRAPVVQMRADQDIVAHRQAGKRLHDLEGAGDAAPRQPMRRLAGDVFAGIADRAFARREEAGDDGKQRGLAGAIRADQRGDAAGFGAASEAALTASRPPKRRDTRSTTRSGSAMDRPPRSAAAAGARRRNRVRACARPPISPRGKKPDDQHEHGAIDDKIEAGRVAGHQLRSLAQRLDDQRAEPAARTRCRRRR